MKNILCFLLVALSTSASYAQNGDCSTSIRLKNMATYIQSSMNGQGLDVVEADDTRCHPDKNMETNAAWLSWEIKESGSLYFDLTPLIGGDDLDFVLYKITDTNGALCDNKKSIRCMASGYSLQLSEKSNATCAGKTGLRPTSSDKAEKMGCNKSDDNYLSALNVKEGNQYVLLVNNFNSSAGFKLDFFGTASFNDNELLGIADLYPNPARDIINIQLTDFAGDITLIEVIDETGKVYNSNQLTSQSKNGNYQLDVSNLVSGVYFVKIVSDGNTVIERFTRM